MASERQIAAKRRNAKKSTGPRSASGRKRPSRTRFVMDWPSRCLADFEAQIETLARQIAEDSVDPARLALAGIASEAELELSQVRASEKGKMIERSLIFGAPKAPVTFVPTLRKFGGSLPSSNG